MGSAAPMEAQVMSRLSPGTRFCRRMIALAIPALLRFSLRATARPAVVVVALVALTCLPPSADAATYRVPEPIAQDCSVDVTAALLSWISSVPDDSTLAFGRNACYRIEGTLEIRRRRGLEFDGHGATFRSFDAPTDQRAVWRAWQSSGLTFRDMTIRGAYGKGGSFTSGLQHGHGIDLRGSSADIESVAIQDVAGDCVYFGLGSDDTTRSSGRVSYGSCSGTSRNAVSVTAGNRIVVEHLTTSEIGYDAFDVEPNIAEGNWGSSDVTFENNTIGSYYLAAYSLVENAPVTNQSFTGNRVLGDSLRIFVGPVSRVVAQARHVTITGNVSDRGNPPTSLHLSGVQGLTVTGNSVPAAAQSSLSVDRSCAVTIVRNEIPGRWTVTSSSQRACSARARPSSRRGARKPRIPAHSRGGHERGFGTLRFN
jgi:hypothetical protein